MNLTALRTRSSTLFFGIAACLFAARLGAQTTPQAQDPAQSQADHAAGLSGSGAGTASTPAPLQLSLADAVKLALYQNLDIQLANLSVATAQQQHTIARSELLPQAQLDANDVVSRYNVQALVGVTLPGVAPNVRFQSIHIGPSYSMPVFDLTLLRRYQASSHRLAASVQDEKSVREQTVLLTVSEYMAHLRALASTKAAASRVHLAEELARQAHDLFADGVATRIDVSRAEVRLREEQQQLIDAETEVKTTTYALRRVLNLPDSQELAFSDSDTFFQTPSLQVVDPLGTAFEQRPELASLAQQKAAAISDRKAAFAESLPSLHFDGFWDEQARTLQTLAPGYEYHMSFSVPIFTSGRLRAERKQGAVEETIADRNLAVARNNVTEQVRAAEAELDAARHQVELGRQEVDLAQDEITLSRGRFAAGVTDNLEVTAAQDLLAHANDSEIAALFRYNIARAQFARAIGSIEQTYSQP